MAQILFLAICAFFCLTLGDALKCRQCFSLHRDDPCEPLDECDIDPEFETCLTFIIYFKKRLGHKVLTCKRKDYAHCGTIFYIRRQGVNVVYDCCTDKDFCNQKYIKRRV